MFCLMEAGTAKWTLLDILMHWQWDALVFGGGGFLIVTLVLSGILVYRENGKKN